MTLKNNSKHNEEKIRELSEENEQLRKRLAEQNIEWRKCSVHDKLFNSLNDCVVVYRAINNGKDFIIFDLNSAAEKTDKVKKSDVIGKNILDATSGIKEFGYPEVLQRVWKTGIAEHHPLTLFKDERTSGWRQNYIFKIPGEDYVASIFEDVTEREKIKAEILNISKIAEEDPYPVMRVSQDLTLLYANPGSKILLSYWKIGQGDKIPGKDSELAVSISDNSQKLSDVINLATEKYKHALIEVDCKEVIYSLVIAPVKEGNYVNIYGRDITFRRKIEIELKKANRMYAFISQVNQTIVRTDNETDLFKKICSTAIEHGKFNYAWIGIVNYDQECIVPVEFTGEEGNFLSKIKIPINETVTEGLGPAPKAVREKRVIISNNIEEDPAKYSIKNNILTSKYLSAAAVPFYLNNTVYGILGVFTYEKDFFDKDEVDLLNEISSDISFALQQISLKEESKNHLTEDIEIQKRQRKILEEMPVGIISCDIDGNILFINEQMLEMLGSQSMEETKSINLLNFSPLNEIGFSDAINNCKKTRNKIVLESYYVSKWGKKSFYQCHFLPLGNEHKDITTILIMAADLSEQKRLEISLKECEERFKKLTIN